MEEDVEASMSSDGHVLPCGSAEVATMLEVPLADDGRAAGASTGGRG